MMFISLLKRCFFFQKQNSLHKFDMLAMTIHLERSTISECMLFMGCQLYHATPASCLRNYDNPTISYQLENKDFSCLYSTRITRNSPLLARTI